MIQNPETLVHVVIYQTATASKTATAFRGTGFLLYPVKYGPSEMQDQIQTTPYTTEESNARIYANHSQVPVEKPEFFKEEEIYRDMEIFST